MTLRRCIRYHRCYRHPQPLAEKVEGTATGILLADGIVAVAPRLRQRHAGLVAVAVDFPLLPSLLPPAGQVAAKLDRLREHLAQTK